MTKDLIFLLQALIIIALPFALLRLLRLRGMVPLVVLQILLGIALGPSCFGRFAPEAYSVLLDRSTLGPLSGIASMAVLIFGFITGLHTHSDSFRRRGGAFAAIAVASVAIPTLLGVFGGWYLGARNPEALGPHSDLPLFAAGIGICVGVTALPVLGSILREMDLLGGRLASMALGVAAVNDGALWLLLCALLAVATGKTSNQHDILLVLLALPVYLLIMFQLVRPLLVRAAARLLRDTSEDELILAVACALAIGSAVVTQILGLHYIFGAFLAGAVMPRELREPILARLELMTISVLMPFFFMITGLRTQIDISSALFVEILVVTTLIGTIGKVGGTALVGVLVGESWRSALCLGTLVQTKGLMEIVVLTVLLEQGIISSTSFAALTVMAVISTAAVMPLSRLFLPRLQLRGAEQ